MVGGDVVLINAATTLVIDVIGKALH